MYISFKDGNDLIYELKRCDIEEESDDEGIDKVMGKFIFKNKTP
jgi:hypothetical protein